MAKIGKHEFEQKILNKMKQIGIPVTVIYLDENLNISYPTITKMLLEMQKNGSVKKLKNTGKNLWTLPNYHPIFED